MQARPHRAVHTGERQGGDELRLTAAWVMGQDNTAPEFHQALLHLLADPDPMVRRNAALGLVRFADASGHDEIVAMLSPTTIVAPAAGVISIRVKSGDTVKVHTVLTNNPTRLAANNVPADQIEQSLKDIYAEGAVATADKGPGGHILTGPIFVEGAEPGDVLEIRIQAIDLAIPYAYNGFGRTSGFLPEDFPYSKTKIIPLDQKRMVANFGPGIEIPLHPFFGSMGVAPPLAAGRVSSVPPGVYGGNMDNKYLVAGTTLYLPVNAEGALFEVGDGHAGQGDGEVDITAMETSLVG